MGLLCEGSPLSWSETKKLQDHVRQFGIQQFINLYTNQKGRQDDHFKWGDEVEYIIVKFDHLQRTAKVSLKASKLLNDLKKLEADNESRDSKSIWHPEYPEYMIESIPGQPYGSLVQYFNTVEHNMSFRRNKLQFVLEQDEVPLTITNFFRLGCPDFAYPQATPNPNEGSSQSLFFPEEAISQFNPRYKAVTANIRQRRGEKVAINVPIFKDKRTAKPFVENLQLLGDDGCSANAAKEDHVYMDASGFGAGCCCLQVTFQTQNIAEARLLYDQLIPICPVMLALTAASPIFRGYLTDVDCRWDVISSSVDCRTAEERGLEPLKENRFVIPKSRFSSVDMYLSEYGAKFNDIDVVYDKEIYENLLKNGVSELFAQHISHLFIRDCIYLFPENIDQNDENKLDNFEAFQSANYRTMRLKVPPPDSAIGWRVEFRPCETHITDFENAAFSVFIILLTRAILSFKLQMCIPISQVEENMATSQKRNAILEDKFWFRQDIFSKDLPTRDVALPMTVNEIINGKGKDFVGLVPLVRHYIGIVDFDADTACTIQKYLKLISLRASGTVMTTAAWIRKFVVSHPDYKQDSVVSELISYDLLRVVAEITQGKKLCPDLLGMDIRTKTSQTIPKVFEKLLV